MQRSTLALLAACSRPDEPTIVVESAVGLATVTAGPGPLHQPAAGTGRVPSLSTLGMGGHE